MNVNPISSQTNTINNTAFESRQVVSSGLPKASVTSNIDHSNHYFKEQVQKEPVGTKLAQQVTQMLAQGKAQIKGEFSQDLTTITLFELPDGKIYTRVRDLNNGDVKYFPALDTAYAYNKAMRPSIQFDKNSFYQGEI